MLEQNRDEPANLIHGLQSGFLERLSPQEKLRIFDLTARASRALHRWAAQYPLIRRVRVWPLSLSVAAAAPFATVEMIVDIARINLWVFTIDDLFDEEMVPFPVLKQRAERYKKSVRRYPEDGRSGSDSLARALQDIHQSLQSYPLFPALEAEWVQALYGTLDGMMCEHLWRTLYREDPASPELPSYDGYLAQSLYTIGAPTHIWTTLIAIGDPSILACMPHIKKMERLVSLGIRLANDLQSYQKEIEEDKINSIVIRQRVAAGQGHGEQEAREMAFEAARADIRESLRELAELRRDSKSATGQPEQALCDIAQFVCDFYVHHDYHTFTAGTRLN